MIYLDNASTTPVDQRVIEAMLPYLKEQYGNPSTQYSLGRKAKDGVEKARRQVASLINATPEQIIFTSGGTEANNLALLGVAEYLKRINKTHIITSKIEHESVLRSVQYLSNHGFTVDYIGVDTQGVIDISTLESSITDATGIVSIMYVNNETGSVNPIEEIAKICSVHDILFHTDCVQALGSNIIDVFKIGCDLVSISSHKVHGVKGAGALFVKNRRILSPIIYGGDGQEFGMRGGTEGVPLIVAFGEACEIVKMNLRSIDIETSYVKQTFYQTLVRELKTYGLEQLCHINGEPIVKHGKIINLRFDGIDGETLLLMLDAKSVCVSSGSACRSHENTPSRVLISMGLTEDEARDSIRVSFSRMNTSEEVIRAAEIIAQCVKLLRD